MSSSAAEDEKKRAEAARANLDKLELTPEEMNKFETAFKDPEFKKMFADYAKEISDPKNKAESDAYLRQLEYENKVESVYGKGVQLVIPVPGFAAKTTDKNKKAEPGGGKVFINVCHTDKCEDATSVKMAGGLQWSVPHTLGQAHEEKDKQGNACTAYDFCVSTHTYGLTQSDERLKTMVVETAIEAVNRAYKTELDLKFSLPKKKFMGEKPGVQAIKGEKQQGGKVSGGPLEDGAAPTGRIQPMATPSGAPPPGPGKDAPEAVSSAFNFDKAVKRPAKPTKPEKEPEGECEPRHEIIHREGATDLSKTFGNSSASKAMEKRRDNRPAALVVRVNTPKIDSIAGAELDVNDSKLFFCVPGKYRLDLELPYEVYGDDGKAKFDKTARRLEVTLPVKPGEVTPAEPFKEPKLVVEADEDEDEDEDGFAKVASPGPTAKKKAETVSAVGAGSGAGAVGGGTTAAGGKVGKNGAGGSGDSDEESGYVMVDKDEARAAASAAAAVAAAKAFEESGETENQRLWREMCERQAAEKAAKEAEAAPRPPPTPAAPAAHALAGDGGDTSDEDEEGEQPPPAAAAAAAPSPAAPSVTYIRPSLGGSSLDDELD